MSKPANKALIGMFVLGGLAIAIIAVAILGSGKLFSNKVEAVMYFQGSVKGLNVGSPVMFRGVRVGSVKNIVLLFDRKDLKFLIPVYVEIDVNKITAVGDVRRDDDDEELKYFNDLIKIGLRGQLELQSVLTGQLMINLDFFPDSKVKFVGMDKDYKEIPTIPSGLEEFLKTAQELPLKDLFNKLLKSIEGIEKVVNSPNISSSLASLDESLKETRAILAKVDKEIGPLMTNIKDASDSVKSIARNTEAVPGQIEKTLFVAQDALKQAEKTLVTMQGLISENSSLAQETGITLREVSGAARSIRSLADYLQRHPESLIQGKKSGKGE